MKRYFALIGALLIFLAPDSYGQLPVIIPNPPPIILPLDTTRLYTGKLSDIATVTSPPGSEPVVSFTPKSFNCSNLGVQNISVVAYNTTHRTPMAVSFERPEGVTFDSKGNLFVAEDGHDIRKIDPAGNVTVFAGDNEIGFADGPAATARFNSVIGIIADGSDNLYVTDAGNARIRKIDVNGTVSTIAGTGFEGTQDGPGSTATFIDPVGITLDHNGNIYVTDEFANNVRKINAAGIVSTVAGDGQAGYMNGQGAIAEFNFPSGICADASGNLFVSDSNNHALREITPQGDVSTFAGGAIGAVDGIGTGAGFELPESLCMDVKGKMFMGDYTIVREITPAGKVTTIAGSINFGFVNGPGNTASFKFITGIYINSYGVIDVADPNNAAIRQICPDTLVSTLAGTGTFGTQNGNIGNIQISDCMVQEDIAVDVEDPSGSCEVKSLFIPNTFTPNGDGFNDVWRIAGLSTHPGCSVQIYSRYGQLLFKSKGYLKPWDGDYNGRPVPSGAYYYIINLPESKVPLSGFVMIIR